MVEQEMRKRAVQVVTENQAYRNPSDATVRDSFTVFGGTLYPVTWQANAPEKKRVENLVFFCQGEARFFQNFEDFVKRVGPAEPALTLSRLTKEFISPSGVAAFLAVLITATILYLVINRPAERIPDVLASSLSSILGFYFGSHVAKRL